MELTSALSTPLSLSVAETRELFFSPIAKNPSLQGLIRQYNRVTRRQKLYELQAIKEILQKAPSCGMQPKGKMNLSDNCLEVTEIGAYLEICFDELKCTIFEKDLPEGYNRADLTGTQIVKLMAMEINDAIVRHRVDAAFFARTASPSDSYNFWDGYFKLFNTAQGGGSIKPSLNAGSGSALVPNQGLVILNDLWFRASDELKMFIAQGLAKFMVTGDIYTNLQQTLIMGNLLNTPQGLTQVNGKIYFMNVEVVPMWTWKQLIENGTATGAPIVDAHWALLTVPLNLAWGDDTQAANVEADSNKMVIWYDINTEKVKFRFRQMGGVNFAFGKLIELAQ